uniref:Uncharacterized protein n=1 Tax=Aegilops tauschii subsp. strangulata TaxID=200361 RepID=A0A453EZH6_AEGTS
MARKRKTDAAPRLDEADRTLYSSFCGAANSLSQLYSQAMAQQKLSFQAGERHALVSNPSLSVLLFFSLRSVVCRNFDWLRV